MKFDTPSKEKVNEIVKVGLVSYGQLLLPPVSAGGEVEELCQILDDFYKNYPSQHKKQTASDLVKGAFYASRPECRSNPDWMSQSANSARDVLYPLFSSEIKSTNILELCRKYAIKTNNNIQNNEFKSTFNQLDLIYKKLSDLTHHGTRAKLSGFSSLEAFLRFTDNDYENLLEDFVITLKRAFTLQQIYIHSLIDSVLEIDVKKVKRDELDLILEINSDAKQYFYSQADEKWLPYLINNGFLDILKVKTVDLNTNGLRMPELHYLSRVAETKPDLVTQFICSYRITASNFNPEIIEQFTRTSGRIPARCLKKIVKKIKDESWIKLMKNYAQYSFDYTDMFKTISEVKDYESLLTLSDAILEVRTKKDIQSRKNGYRGEYIFYVNDLSDTCVFNYLIDLPEDYHERSLEILIKVFKKAVYTTGSGYTLMQDDFFKLRLNSVLKDSYGEELRFITASLIEIIRKIFVREDVDKVSIYNKYFPKLSPNHVSRRLKLFVMSLDPEIFIDKLQIEYFRLFEVKKPITVLYGAEYENSLKAGFRFLSESSKRGYIAKLFTLFSKRSEKDTEWKTHYASCIFSIISDHLTDTETLFAKENGFKISHNYKPEPSIGRIRSGTVNSRSPFTFDNLSVTGIAEKLGYELTPDNLRKKYKDDDFLSPRDADGVAKELRNDISSRHNEYLKYAHLFFDRTRIAPHYTNAYLQGVKDLLREKKVRLNKTNYSKLILLLSEIKNSGERKSFNNEDIKTEGRWLSNWDTVHSTIADLIEEIIKGGDKKTKLNFNLNRNIILEILKYLLEYNDPIPEDEKIKTAKQTVKNPRDSEYSISDPFMIAINSVRGRSFQALLHFIYQDSTQSNQKEISEDIKELYIHLIDKEKTRAIMFMFGHYLYFYYYRDSDWIRRIIKNIFESSKKSKYLHLAVWEGYLSNNVYYELFSDPYIQSLYLKNISWKISYPKQKFFKDPRKAIADHIALAFVHYEDFGTKHKLIRKFFEEASEEQLAQFIDLIGDSFIRGKNSKLLKGTENLWRKRRVESLWVSMLKNPKEKSLLRVFGPWIDVKNAVFETKWLAEMTKKTLEATNGELKWDYGLLVSIEKLAKVAPESTLIILEKYFLGPINKKDRHRYIQDDKEWYNAFNNLYTNQDQMVRNGTKVLMNRLIKDGGSQFWILKKILSKKKKKSNH